MTRITAMRPVAVLIACSFIAVLAACGQREKPAAEAEHAEAADYERGPHRGRMLRDGDFAVEVTIFEDGVPPEFHVHAYRKDKPVDPKSVQLTVELSRLGDRVDRFAFSPTEDYLRGQGVVREPHSFDVRVTAAEGGRTHRWSYASHEGRTTISAQAAQAGGVRSERAGPATIAESIDLAGRIEITPEGRAAVRAWYPGRIMSLSAELGQPVRKGQVLARVESSNSLQTYAIPAPISGVIVEKNATVGETTEGPLYVIADPNDLHAELFVYPRDAERIRAGQTVEVRSLSGDARVPGRIETVLPTADITSQTLVAHVPIKGGPAWRPGMAVEGAVAVNSTQVPLAVRTKALQRFRDVTVVYAKVGNTYEVRMLELGRKTAEWTEVLGGLEPGAEYVTDGAYLIRADIEKSGAGHDH